MYTASGLAHGVEIAPGVFNLVFARNGAFIYLAAGDGTIWWSAQVSEPQPPDLDAVDLATRSHLFRHEEVPTAVLRAETSMQRPTLHHGLAPIPIWHNPSMVLLGGRRASGRGRAGSLDGD